MNTPDRKVSSGDLRYLGPRAGFILHPDSVRRQEKENDLFSAAKRLATLPVTLMRKYPLQIVGLGSLAILMIIGDQPEAPDRALAIQRGDIPKNTAPSSMVDPEQQTKEDAIRREYLKIPEPPLNSGEYLKLTETLLSERGLNMMDFSFRESMTKLGYEVGPLEIFGTQARIVKAGKDGNLRRYWPNTELGYAVGKPITRGETFPLFGITSVLDEKSGIIDFFGLTEPWRVTQVPDSQQQLVQSPNMIRGKQYEPSWIRLIRIHPSGRIESFLDPQENVDSLIGNRSDMVQAYQQRYLKDGSIDYGNGVIGPSLADQSRSK